jgi:hypothetical protein
MPYYPLPPVLGIVLNLVLTVVLIRFLVRTDPLALALSAGWILLGVVAYAGLGRVRTTGEAGGQAAENRTGSEPGSERGTIADED